APPPRSKVSKPSSATRSPSALSNPSTRPCVPPPIQRAQWGFPMPSNPAQLAECGFGARLRRLAGARGPLCAGIDPHPELLGEWGLGDSVGGLERFALGAVEALGPVV